MIPSSASITISRPVTIVVIQEYPRREVAAQQEHRDDQDAGGEPRAQRRDRDRGGVSAAITLARNAVPQKNIVTSRQIAGVAPRSDYLRPATDG